MTDIDAVSWFYMNCLRPGVKRIADAGAFLAESGLLSRSYLDANLDESIQIDTWEQSDFSIFPAQRHIYDSIYEKGFMPEKEYDVVFFFENHQGRVSKDTVLWAMSHGKTLIFQEDLLYPEFLETELCNYPIEIYKQGASFFFQVKMQ